MSIRPLTARPLACFAALFGLAGLALVAHPSGVPVEERMSEVAATRPVDIVVALDTSGSMDGLLDATRARIWDVVNTLAKLQPQPELRVGLITFGTERATEEEGFIVLESDLSDSLDDVYGALMRLETKGGEEYVGRVIRESIERMSWSADHDALKILFVAGNESADQAVEQADFRTTARWAREQGIFVNALYAGNRDQAVIELWPDVARAGGGSFASIDPEKSTIQIAAPQDDDLLALNDRLNGTYVPYGPEGMNGLANQVAQDSNASRLGVESCSARIVAKGSALYSNATWDLVDATSKGTVDLATIATGDLPDEMRGMTTDQMISFVDKKRAAREDIQLRIQELSVERETYIQGVIAKERLARGLDAAMKQSLLEQAEKKGFDTDGC